MSWYELMLAVAAGLTAAAAIWKSISFFRGQAFGVFEWMAAMYNLPENSNRQFAELSEIVEEVRREVRTNGGTSLRDAIFRMEHDLRYTVTRQRTILENQHLKIFETDSAGDCVYANDPYLELVGRPFSEVHGKGWLTCIHPEDRDYVNKEWFEAVADKRTFMANYRMRKPNGRTYNVVGEAKSVDGRDGNSIGYIGIVRVINEVKELDI